MRIRVVVYNVHGFRHGIARVTGVVDRLEPDVLLLNESGGRLRLRSFARSVGMDLAHDPWTPLRRRVKNAVLVRGPWRVAEHRLHRFAGRSFLLPRGAVIARLERGGTRLLAVSTHLGLHPRERLDNARELSGLLAGSGDSTIVGGDLNARPDERAVSVLADRFTDAWAAATGRGGGDTFPAPDPRARIDYLFVSEGVTIEGVRVPGDDEARAASDHRPLVAELTLPERR